MALAGELVDLFQGLTPEASAAVMTQPAQTERVREEVADVFADLPQLVDVLDIELAATLRCARRSDRTKIATRCHSSRTGRQVRPERTCLPTYDPDAELW